MLFAQIFQQLATVLSHAQVVIEQIDVELFFLATATSLFGGTENGDLIESNIDQHRLHQHLKRALIIHQENFFVPEE